MGRGMATETSASKPVQFQKDSRFFFFKILPLVEKNKSFFSLKKKYFLGFVLVTRA